MRLFQLLFSSVQAWDNCRQIDSIATAITLGWSEPSSKLTELLCLEVALMQCRIFSLAWVESNVACGRQSLLMFSTQAQRCFGSVAKHRLWGQNPLGYGMGLWMRSSLGHVGFGDVLIVVVAAARDRYRFCHVGLSRTRMLTHSPVLTRLLQVLAGNSCTTSSRRRSSR
eukprot:3376763-Amphidinium_carterae.1